MELKELIQKRSTLQEQLKKLPSGLTEIQSSIEDQIDDLEKKLQSQQNAEALTGLHDAAEKFGASVKDKLPEFQGVIGITLNIDAKSGIYVKSGNRKQLRPLAPGNQPKKSFKVTNPDSGKAFYFIEESLASITKSKDLGTKPVGENRSAREWLQRESYNGVANFKVEEVSKEEATNKQK